MKLEELKSGDKISGFDGWGCVPKNAKRAVLFCDDGPYVECKEGRHLLDGQIGDDGHLVGMCFA